VGAEAAEVARARAVLAWAATALLVLVGVASTALRGAYLPDLAARTEPTRQRVLRALGAADPPAAGRAAELERFDRRFAAHPRATRLHILPGALFLLLAPLQFAPRLRSGFPRLHRWSGRLLLALGLVTAATGFYFGLLMPFGGAAEAVAIALFGGVFLAALALAFVAIRRGEVARHRAWMIRAFAVAAGIATVRLVGAVFEVVLTPAGWHPRSIFVLGLWTGWSLTLAAGEVWIASVNFVAPTESSSRR
jgi:uncharacterized membrane protein